MEVVIFGIVALVAVGAAVGMLLNQNAVLSALCLILNFVCVAFLYLMLDAPFLAMVQIAVYAGAIMVLFLFVIMLLGAEKVGQSSREFKWLTPVTLVLALSFVFATYFAFSAGQIDTQDDAGSDPLVRVVHAAAGFPEAVDVYANGELLLSSLALSEASEFLRVPAGDYAIAIAPAGGDPARSLPLGNLTLAADTVHTAVAYGAQRLPALGVVSEDLSDTPDRSTRLVVFNAYPEMTVSLVAPGADFTSVAPEVFIESLAPGTGAAPFLVRDDEVEWAFVNADNPSQELFRLRELAFTASAAQLLILGSEPQGVGEGIRPTSISLTSETLASFGSPRAIGESLFIKYVLPFEIVAVLLLAAMVGAIVLTHREDIKPKPGRPMRRKVSRPLTSVIAAQTGHAVIEDSVEVPRLKEPEQPEPAGD